MQLTPAQQSAVLAQMQEILPQARWFRGKARTLTGLMVEADAPVALGDGTTAHFLGIRADYTNGEPEHYSVPILAPELSDALAAPAFRALLLRLIVEGGRIETPDGVLAGHPGRAVLGCSTDLPSTALALEQSNSAVVYGEEFFLKFFRVPEEGENPDIELGRYLTEQADFIHAPIFAGTLTLERGRGAPRMLALLQRRIAARGDAWPRAVELAAADLSSGRGGASEAALALASELGLHTAEMHAALARATEPALAPEPFRASDHEELEIRARQRCAATAGLLQERGQADSPLVAALHARAATVDALVAGSGGLLIRVHGDYHLGQVLVREDGALIITDFEGEPARSMAERRQKRSPLVDVAGMLRSFDYAAATAARATGLPGSAAWREAMCAAFTQHYFEALPAHLLPPEPIRTHVLEDLLLEKAAYEVAYELNNRPDWSAIPLGGLERILRIV